MLVGSVAEGVEMVMGPALILMGVSHIVRPDIWSKLFAELHAMGSTGVIYRTFMLELWPAMAIVTLHQVWSGPGIALTLYGTLLALKCAVAVLFPEIGGRSMVLARGAARSFVPGGIMLVALGGSCIWALLT